MHILRSEDVASDDAFPSASIGTFYPNREKDIQLHCGCWIPWPIITLLGSGRGEIEKRSVWCSEHGWQKRITLAQIQKAKERLRKELAKERSGQLDIPPF